MRLSDYRSLETEQLTDLLFMAEDRLEAGAIAEMARRDEMLPILIQVVTTKHNWLSELPAWWAVVHATYSLGLRGGEEAAPPLLAALRWSDAYDCDWVTEVLPSIFGRLGPPAIPGLTSVVRDSAAGWSVRDVAMKGLAAISLSHTDSAEHVFRIIGERFMDEGEERSVRQLAGLILLDFRRADYRLAMIHFAKESPLVSDMDLWYIPGLNSEEVEWAFRGGEPELWHYTDDWMRFYDPAEIQRRQKRWMRERMGYGRGGRDQQQPSGGGGRVLPLWDPSPGGAPPESPPDSDPDTSGKS